MINNEPFTKASLVFGLLLSLLSATATAQNYPSPTYQNVTILGTLNVAPYQSTPISHQDFSSSTLASAQSLTVPNGAKYAILFVEGSGGLDGNCVRFFDDGTTPTGDDGAPFQPGVIYGYTGSLPAFRVIQATQATCSMTVIYYK